MKFILFLFLTFDKLKFKAFNGGISLISKEAEPSDTVYECILNILTRDAYRPKKIALRYDKEEVQETIVEKFFKLSELPFTANADELPKGLQLDTRLASDFVVVLNEFVNFTNYLDSNVYAARTIFLVVVWKKFDLIGKFFKEFWKYNMINVYALKVEKGEVQIYHFIPFVKCSLSEPIILDIWSENQFRLDGIKKIGSAYSPSVLEGCKFTVSTFHLPPTVIFRDQNSTRGTYEVDGIEGRLMMAIVERINSTFLFRAPEDGERWGQVYPEPKGATGELYLKKSSFACGAHALTVERFVSFDAVMLTAVQECVTWSVPKGAAKGQPVWLGIYLTEFSSLMWLSVAGSTLFTIIIFYNASRLMKSTPFLDIFDVFMLMLASSFRMTVEFPKITVLKILFSTWLWFSMIVGVAYESSMRSKLTVPLRHRDVNTFVDLLETDLELYGIEHTMNVIFRGNEDALAKVLWKRTMPSTFTLSEAVKKIVKDRKIGYLRETTTFIYNAYKDRETIGQIHTMKQCVYSYYPVILLEKRSPFTNLMSHTVSALIESGILLWWRSLFMREAAPFNPTVVKLTLEHMTVPFIAYGIGIILSIALFAVENIMHHRNRKKKTLSAARSYKLKNVT